jgi:IS5 family transposase
MVEVTKGARAMEQISFAAAEYAVKRKKTRREVFLEEMVPWKALMKLIEPFCPAAGRALRAPL